jgi:hypothetical protein
MRRSRRVPAHGTTARRRRPPVVRWPGSRADGRSDCPAWVVTPSRGLDQVGPRRRHRCGQHASDHASGGRSSPMTWRWRSLVGDEHRTAAQRSDVQPLLGQGPSSSEPLDRP